MNGQVVYSYKPLPGAEKRIYDKISDITISMGFDMYSSQIDRIGQFHRYHAFVVVDSGCTDLSVGGDP